jgi:O-acetylhomoserine/O-acetylserine sulfhydrylase-like pyridoxal-dependent enzyme
MKAMKDYNELSMDELDLAVTERHLQNETILWIYDPSNEDFQEIFTKFSLPIKLIPISDADEKKIDFEIYTIILMDCFYDPETTLTFNAKIKSLNKKAVVMVVVDKSKPASYILHPIHSDHFWKIIMNEIQLKREKSINSQSV